MLKVILVGFVVMSTFVCSYGQTRVGVHTGYATGFNEMKFGVNGEVFLTHRASLTSSISFYTPQEKPEVTTRYWEFSLDGRLYLFQGVATNLYGIFGLDFVHSKANNEQDEHKEGNFWFNAGAGAIFGTGKIHPFFESKFVSSAGELQAVLTAGIRFDLNKYETD